MCATEKDHFGLEFTDVSIIADGKFPALTASVGAHPALPGAGPFSSGVTMDLGLTGRWPWCTRPAKAWGRAEAPECPEGANLVDYRARRGRPAGRCRASAGPPGIEVRRGGRHHHARGRTAPRRLPHRWMCSSPIPAARRPVTSAIGRDAWIAALDANMLTPST